ncbi:hypothetical protein PENSPDRAFT_758522 [Peniophora sp. CONT]|nr:hypothetical protein PENSPDRAFT_758522 [Peniophora sp. CONT]
MSTFPKALEPYHLGALGDLTPCSICADPGRRRKRPFRHPAPTDTSKPVLPGEIRKTFSSVLNPFVKHFSPNIPLGHGRERPYIVLSEAEGKGRLTALGATYKGYRGGQGGLHNMPEMVQFFSVEVAQILYTNAGLGRGQRYDYLTPTSKFHFHTSREWRGDHRQYAIALPYTLSVQSDSDHPVWTQGDRGKQIAVTVESDELDRFREICDGLQQAWNDAEEEEPDVVLDMLDALKFHLKKELGNGNEINVARMVIEGVNKAMDALLSDAGKKDVAEPITRPPAHIARPQSLSSSPEVQSNENVPPSTTHANTETPALTQSHVPDSGAFTYAGMARQGVTVAGPLASTPATMAGLVLPSSSSLALDMTPQVLSGDSTFSPGASSYAAVLNQKTDSPTSANEIASSSQTGESSANDLPLPTARGPSTLKRFENNLMNLGSNIMAPIRSRSSSRDEQGEKGIDAGPFILPAGRRYKKKGRAA